MIGKGIGPYKILEKIGQGSLGIVYKGIHQRLEHAVAIKVLAPEYAGDPTIRQRFMAEAQIQARFMHPHMVNVLNTLTEDHNVCLVMEYVEGETLAQRLARLGCLPQEEAVSIGRDILSALDFMHSQAILHQDIKPNNIMLTATGMVKVADFGLAKVASDSTLMSTGMYLDSLCYMSPEQIQGKPASVASDVYALGVTLYQMVTGGLPFPSDSEYTLVKGHIENIPAPPWELNAQVSQTLGQIILKALEKKPEHRYPSARDFARALSAFMHQPDDALMAPAGIRGRLEKRRAAWLSVALLTGGGLALGLLGYLVLLPPLSPLLATMPVSDVTRPSASVPVPEQIPAATANLVALPAVPPEPNGARAPSARRSPPLTLHNPGVQEHSKAQKETAIAVPLRSQPVDVLVPIPAPREEQRSSRDEAPKEQISRAEETTALPSKPKSRVKPKVSAIKERSAGWRIEKSDGRIVR